MTSPRPPIRFAFALTLALAACDTPAETPPETNACDNDPTACGMVSGATCTPAGDSFTCDCPAGYASPGVGARCDELDECDAGPELACGLATATCSNTVGSYRCTCPAGYANAGLGTPCAPLDPGACDPGYAPTGQNGACQDINECQPGAEATCGLPNASCSNNHCVIAILELLLVFRPDWTRAGPGWNRPEEPFQKFLGAWPGASGACAR